MLGLAVLPMVGVILLTNALRPEGDSTTAERRAWQTSTAAADLTARVGELETSVLGVAADPELPQLADGVDGAEERQVAARALVALGVGDESLIQAACITRASDPAGVPLTGSAPALGMPGSASGSEAGSGALCLGGRDRPCPGCPARCRGP